MIGVIARSRWGWWSWLARSVDRSTQSLRHSLPLSRDSRSPCRHEASALGAAPGAPANFQYPFGGTRHPALMHRAVQAVGAREWRKAGALCAESPGRDHRRVQSSSFSALVTFNAMAFNSSLLCPATLASTPIENCSHQAVYFRDGGVPSTPMLYIRAVSTGALPARIKASISSST
jgi:hypothetical protein